MNLVLSITDPEVLRYLERGGVDEQAMRVRALTAMRIGVLALSSAEGVIDADAIKREGAAIVHGVREMLTTHAQSVATQVGNSLTQYLHPQTGAFQQGALRLLEREDQVVKDLEKKIQALLGDTGPMAQSIAKQVGTGSPLFQMLDPKQRESLYGKVEALVARNIEEQRLAVAREFSLDRPESALSRLVLTITERNANFSRELSLDHADSALSRLVGRVEAAQKLTVDQFSLDNADSGMTRMRRLIDDQFTELGDKQLAFQNNVLEMLARFDEKKRVAATGTQHGMAFEFELLQQMENIAEGAGELFDATGATTGTVRNCKVGDAVITIGPDRVGAGARIVYEAKEDQSYGDTKALAEIELGMKNRNAEVGVFVFSKRTAPHSMKPLRRIGNAVLVVWDSADPLSIVYLEAAHSVATALITKAAKEKDAAEFDFAKIDTDIAEAEKLAERIANVIKKCDTIKSAVQSIEDEVRISADKLGGVSRRLRVQIERLKLEL
jgi:hypothetical protein